MATTWKRCATSRKPDCELLSFDADSGEHQGQYLPAAPVSTRPVDVLPELAEFAQRPRCFCKQVIKSDAALLPLRFHRFNHFFDASISGGGIESQLLGGKTIAHAAQLGGVRR